ISKRQNQLVALLCCSVTNTIYFESFCISFTYSDNHVLDQGSCQSVQGFHLLQVVRSCNNNMAVFLFDLHLSRQNSFQSTFRSFYCYVVVFLDFYGNSCRNCHWQSSNT